MSSTRTDAADEPRETPVTFSRDQILTEAITLLEENGTLGFRLHDLAQRLGVTVSALYYHFRNRDAIVQEAYLEVFRRDTRANLALVTALATTQPSDDERTRRLSELVSELTEARVRRMRRTRLTALTTLPDERRFREALGEVLHHAQTETADAYRERQRAGTIRSDLDPAALALFTRALLAGLVVWDYDQSMNVSPEAFAKVLSAVMEGLSTSAQGVAPPSTEA